MEHAVFQSFVILFSWFCVEVIVQDSRAANRYWKAVEIIQEFENQRLDRAIEIHHQNYLRMKSDAEDRRCNDAKSGD